jgi:hypothetical protein
MAEKPDGARLGKGYQELAAQTFRMIFTKAVLERIEPTPVIYHRCQILEIANTATGTVSPAAIFGQLSRERFLSLLP